MQHVKALKRGVFTLAAGFILLGTSASFAQCMGGAGMGGIGPGMSGGPRMMGMGGTGMASGGASMMNMQQAMQMAQMVQQMRSMQVERLRMMNAERSRQTARGPRNRGSGNREFSRRNASARTDPHAVNSLQGKQQSLEANTDAPALQTSQGAGRTATNRRSAGNRGN